MAAPDTEKEATAEFQQTKKDPMRARASAYWLGRCFADLGKVPLAVKQLQAALEGVQKLDDLAKETHYALGQALLAARKVDPQALTRSVKDAAD